MTEYILTSDPEVRAIAEQGRRMALVLATESIGAAQRSALWTLKEATQEHSFSDYDRDAMTTAVFAHMHEAREHVKQACQSDRFDRERYGYVNRIARMETLPALTHVGQPSWESSIRAIMEGYVEYRTGVTLERLTAFYEATDPSLPSEYAKALLDA